MKPSLHGIEVERGSTIIITSLGRNMNQNLTAPPLTAKWGTLNSPIVITNQGLEQRGTFQAPQAPDHCNVVVEFNFKSAVGGIFPPGMDYVVTITEITPGGQTTTIEDPPPVTPPPFVDRSYRFITR